MALEIEDLHQSIEQAKDKLKQNLPNYRECYDSIRLAVMKEMAAIREQQQETGSVIPELAFSDIHRLTDDAALRAQVQRRGCVVVRNCFDQQKAEGWSDEIARYLEGNNYLTQEIDPSLDQYFSSLQKGKPQIYSVYWSKPQVQARQSAELAAVRSQLNRLWQYDHEGHQEFDPDRECTYADRTRRREPGDDSLGLKPHIDGGSVERWIDPGFQYVYRHVFAGNWQAFNAFDAIGRTNTQEIKSPAVCSMFRTFQGWTALSKQGPGDGTLQLVPSTLAMPYLLLRALQDDVPAGELCGAAPGRALSADPEWHAELLEGLVSIPHMNAGDTIWWHPDVVHAVEDEHQGKAYSNVIYIGAAPLCDKNAAFMEGQAEAFKAGKSSPDFAAENYELNYSDRATEADLSTLGKQQLGLAPW